MKLNLSALSDAEVIELAVRRLPGPPSRGDGRRYVRTPEGSRKYGLPIGALITPDAIKRASKRFPGVKAPEDNDRTSEAKAPTTPRARKTAKQVTEAIKKSPDLDPKRAKFSKLDGDQRTLVGSHVHNLPSGSKVFRTKGDKSVAIARTPDYNLYILTPKGRALDIRDRDTENELNERLDDLNEGDEDFDVEVLGEDPDATSPGIQTQIDRMADEAAGDSDPDSPNEDGYDDSRNVDTELEDIASRLEDMADRAENDDEAQQYRDLAQQLRDEKAKPKRAVEPKRAAKDESGGSNKGQKDGGAPKRAQTETTGDETTSDKPAPRRPAKPRKPAPPRRKAATPRAERDTSQREPKDLDDKELDDVLSDLTAAQETLPKNDELDARVEALKAEKESRGSASPDAPDEDGEPSVRDTLQKALQDEVDGKGPETKKIRSGSDSESSFEPAGDVPETAAREQLQKEMASQTAKLDANPLGDRRLTRKEMAELGAVPGEGAFRNEVVDRNDVLNARIGDKFIVRKNGIHDLWGLEEDGRFHPLGDAWDDDVHLSVAEFADMLEPHPVFGKADVFAFSGNKNNKNKRPDPKPGDIAPAHWVDGAPEQSQARDGSGILGEKNADGTFRTPLGDLPPDFFKPGDVEADDAVVVRNGPDPDGKPAGATVRVTSKKELVEIKSGDAIVAGDLAIERRRDGSFEADVDGLKIDLTPEQVEHFVENGEADAWHTPNQDLVGAPSKEDWEEGDVLQRMDDLNAQEPGAEIELQHQDGTGATRYTVLPNGDVRNEDNQTEVPASVLKSAVASGHVRVSKKASGDALPEAPKKEIKTLADYEVGDKIVDYKHLRRMKPGQQVTLTIPAKENGGKAITVVLTRTDDTKDNAGWMFLVGRRGAGYNAFGENNASIFQAIADGRLHFGNITDLPGAPQQEFMDGDWDTNPNIELWDGGPKVSEKDLRDFINAQIYSRAMQGSYYNVDLLPLNSPFRSQELRKKLSDAAIEKYSTHDEFGNPIPARHKPAMIRWASEKLGLEYGDPGAALIPDDLELDDFRKKVTVGRFIQSGNKADAEAERMGPEQMEISVADIKIAYAIVANMLTSNQEREMAELLGLKKKDLTPDRILKRVMAMRGSPLQDMNVALAIASYYRMRRYKKDENGNWRLLSNVAAARQYDKTRNKKLLLQMLREQMEGRPPGYYGVPEVEEYHWVTDGGADKGWYRNVPSIQRPAINADNDPDGPGPLFRPDGTLSPVDVPDPDPVDAPEMDPLVNPSVARRTERSVHTEALDRDELGDGDQTPSWERALLNRSERKSVVRPGMVDTDAVAQARPGQEFDIIDEDGRAVRVLVNDKGEMIGRSGNKLGGISPEEIQEIIDNGEWIREVPLADHRNGGPEANPRGVLWASTDDLMMAPDGARFVFYNQYGDRFNITMNGDKIDYHDVNIGWRGQWDRAPEVIQTLRQSGHFEKRPADDVSPVADAGASPVEKWGKLPEDLVEGAIIHRRVVNNESHFDQLKVVRRTDGALVIRNDAGVEFNREYLTRNENVWEYRVEYPFSANAPEANAPEANAPEANAPEANAPEANAPEANAQQWGHAVGARLAGRDLDGVGDGVKIQWINADGYQRGVFERRGGEWVDRRGVVRDGLDGWGNRGRGGHFIVLQNPNAAPNAPEANAPEANAPEANAPASPNAPKSPNSPRPSGEVFNPPPPDDDKWGDVVSEDLRAGDVVYRRELAVGDSPHVDKLRVVDDHGALVLEDANGRKLPYHALKMRDVWEFQHAPNPNPGIAQPASIHRPEIPPEIADLKFGQRLNKAQLKALPEGAAVRWKYSRYVVQGDYLVGPWGRLRIEDHYRKHWVFDRFPTTQDVEAARNVEPARNLLRIADEVRYRQREHARKVAEEKERQAYLDAIRGVTDTSLPIEERSKSAALLVSQLRGDKFPSPSPEDRSAEAMQAQLEHFDKGGSVFDAPTQGLYNFMLIREDLFQIKRLRDKNHAVSDVALVKDLRDGSNLVVKVNPAQHAPWDQALHHEVVALELYRAMGYDGARIRAGFGDPGRNLKGDAIIMDNIADVFGAPGARVDPPWKAHGNPGLYIGEKVKDGPDPDALIRLGLFDYMIGNQADRHANNVIGVDIPGQGFKLAFLDFGLAFGVGWGTDVPDWDFDQYVKNSRMRSWDYYKQLRVIYDRDPAALAEAINRELTKILGVDLDGLTERLRSMGMSEEAIEKRVNYVRNRLGRMQDSGFADQVIDAVVGGW